MILTCSTCGGPGETYQGEDTIPCGDCGGEGTRRWDVHHGDALEWLRSLPDHSADSAVMDPPAGISFMAKSWDGDKGGMDAWVEWLRAILAELLRVLKPGAHILVWSIPRTSHWTGRAIELAGFDIQDCIAHVFGSGFPKSHNISKALDRKLGADPVVVGHKPGSSTTAFAGNHNANGATRDTWRDRGGAADGQTPITRPATPEGEAWDGWGTRLKPAVEWWWMARAPLDGTIAQNVLRHAVGGLNIDGCRVQAPPSESGRYPPNLALTHSPDCVEAECVPWCPVQLLDEQSGHQRDGTAVRRNLPPEGASPGAVPIGPRTQRGPDVTYGSGGGASRYFPRFRWTEEERAEWASVLRYCPKPSRSEREAGLDHLPLRASFALNSGGIQGRRDAKREQAIKAGQDQHSQGLDGRGRTLIRADGSKTLVARFIPGARANFHSTVKPIRLMRWFVRLVTPKGGIVLDPFTGSGTTGCAAMLEGARFAGSEMEADYIPIARGRIAHAAGEQVQLEPLGTAAPPPPPVAADDPQMSLFG